MPTSRLPVSVTDNLHWCLRRHHCIGRNKAQQGLLSRVSTSKSVSHVAPDFVLIGRHTTALSRAASTRATVAWVGRHSRHEYSSVEKSQAFSARVLRWRARRLRAGATRGDHHHHSYGRAGGERERGQDLFFLACQPKWTTHHAGLVLSHSRFILVGTGLEKRGGPRSPSLQNFIAALLRQK